MDKPRVVVGAGIDEDGGAALTLELGSSCVIMDIYAAMKLVDLIKKKIGESVQWHKLAYDPDTPKLFGTLCAGTA